MTKESVAFAVFDFRKRQHFRDDWYRILSDRKGCLYLRNAGLSRRKINPNKIEDISRSRKNSQFGFSLYILYKNPST